MAKARRGRVSPRPSNRRTRVRNTSYGVLEISSEREHGQLPSGLELIVQQCSWRPIREVLPSLDENTAVHFRLLTSPEGSRRLKPAIDMKTYSRSAMLIGFEILKQRGELTSDQREDYELLLKLLQRLLRTQAYLRRQFSSVTDLHLKRSSRGKNRATANILPENLGKDCNGCGRKWSIRQLQEVGRARFHEAVQNRMVTPDHQEEYHGQEFIAYGLMAAAERNPLVLRKSQVRSLTRMSLIDLGARAPAKPIKLKQWVTARLRARWNSHLSDTDDQFDAWFQGGRSNLLKSLADLAGQTGGRLDRKDVEWALLELSAQSLWHAATCQKAFGEALLDSINPPLEGDDLKAFNQWYRPQPYLGDLTLPILWERGPILRPILQRIWLNPSNRSNHKILWRVMEFFCQMVAARRIADREAKPKKSRPGNGPVGQTESHDLGEWAEVLGVRGGMACHSPGCNVHYEACAESNSVTISGLCRIHGSLQLLRMPISEARRIIENENEE